MATQSSKRYHASMEYIQSPLEIRDRRIRQLVGRKDFDLAMYLDACTGLAEQERTCESIEDLLRLRHTWFRDAFFPDGNEADLERETLIPPYPFHGAPDHRLYSDPRGGVFSTSQRQRVTDSNRLNGMLYADRVMTNIRSGLAAMVPRQYTDVLGTGELDCCTALAGIREDGTMLLAHIPGPGWSSVRETLDWLAPEIDQMKARYLIYPNLPTEGYHEARAHALAVRSNAEFKQLAEAYSLPAIGYESSSTPGERTPRTSGLRTLVTIDQDGLCLSVNQERVSGKYVYGVERSLRLHYHPLHTRAIAWKS